MVLLLLLLLPLSVVLLLQWVLPQSLESAMVPRGCYAFSLSFSM